MSLRTALAELPDDALVPVGWVRMQLGTPTEESPAVDEEVEATLQMYAHKATRDLCRSAWDSSGGTAPEGRE